MSYEPVRFAIVSPAQWGRLLLNSVKQSSKLRFMGVWGRTEANNADIVANYGGRAFTSYEELLSDPTIEAVLLPTPHFLHYPQSMAALRAGKHVFVEKPIANHLHEAVEMQSFSKECKLVLSVGLGGRRTAGARKVKEMLDRNELGKVALVVVMHGSPHIHQTYKLGDWETSPETMPGGILDQLGVHYAEMLQYLFGSVRRVSGFYNQEISGYHIPDAAGITYEFDSGVVGVHVLHQVSAYISQMSVFATGGILQMNRMGRELLWQEIINLSAAKQNSPQTISIPLDGPDMNSTVLQEELEEFADCIRLDRQPEVGAAEGIAALRLMRAAMIAHETGSVVDLNTSVDLDRPQIDNVGST